MLLFLFFVYLYYGQSQVAAAANYSLAECNRVGNIDVVSNQTTSITCTGLNKRQNIYWSITNGGVDTRIGDCSNCTLSPCGNCSVLNGDYSVIRQPTNTTLRLVANVNANNKSILTCSNTENTSSENCNIIIIEAYDILRCNDNVLQLYQKGKTKVHCTGLHPLQTMYWSILYDNGTEERLAECLNCQDNEKCPACNISNGDYKVTREATSSVLRLVGGDDSSKDGATLKCSKRDNATAAACKLRVSNYTLPQCQNGHIKVSDVSPWTPIRCEALDPSHRVNWTITNTNGTVLHIASCDKRNEGYNCTKDTDDFIVSRISNSASELRIVKKVEEKNFYTLTCLRRDGAAAASCLLRVDHSLMQDQSMALLSTIGGSVGATVFFCVVVIVALIIIRKRRDSGNKKHQTTRGTKRKKKHKDLSVDNPAYNKGPDSILPIQTATVWSTSHTPSSTSGTDVSPDTDDHTYIIVDLDEKEEEKKNSRNASRNMKRVHFCKNTPADKPPSSGELLSIDDENDFHALANKRPELSADADGYNHIAISSKSTEERIQDSENGKLPSHDACVQSLGSKKPSSTEDTPAHSDDYNHIAINPKATEEHLQWGTLQRHDGRRNPPTHKTVLGKTTRMASSHIAINSAVGESTRPKSQTSVGEPNVLDVDPYDRIQTPSHQDETALYENTFEKTAEEFDDEFNRLKFSQLKSKNTEDPEYSHISKHCSRVLGDAFWLKTMLYDNPIVIMYLSNSHVQHISYSV